MIKELLIAFVIALCIGSFINGWQAEESQEAADNSAAAGTSASPDPGGQPAVDQTAVSAADESNFEAEVVDSPTPVLVDFYADACPHCRKMAPVLAEVATELKGTLKVVKVDATANPQLAQKYGIGPLPGFIVFKGGKATDSFVGEMPKSQLLSNLKKYTDSAADSHGA
jgi:thioredoxin 1